MKHALLLAVVFAPILCHGQDRGGIPLPEGIAARQRILGVAAGLVGTREATGHNDGPVIERILKSAAASKGDPYCAAFDFFCYEQAGLSRLVPRSAWSPDWVRNPTWTRAGGGKTPLPGDTWGIFFPSKGRVAHTGIVREWGSQVMRTFEGNTSPDAAVGTEADRNGDGIWSKRRLIRQIHSVRNWLD